MELAEALTKAKESIIQADLPEEWRSEAFNLALRHLLGGSPAAAEPFAGGSAVGQMNPTANAAAAGDQQTAVARLSARVKVPEASLLDVFAFEDDGVKLHVSSTRIAAAKSKATQEVALLIAAARQGSGIDDGWTSTNHVRDALQHYNRYDQGNFASNLKAQALKDAFNSKGKGPGMELRLTQPGWETAIELVQRVAGVQV